MKYKRHKLRYDIFENELPQYVYYSKAHSAYEYIPNTRTHKVQFRCNTLEEMKNYLAECAHDAYMGLDVDTSRTITIRDFAERTAFPELYESSWGSNPNTKLKRIEDWNKHILSHSICDKALYATTQSDIQLFVNSMMKKTYGNNNNLYAISTIENIITLLRQVFDVAVRRRIIASNPVFKLKYGNKEKEYKKRKKHPEKGKALNLDELKRLLIFVQDHKDFNYYYPLILFDFSAGLRGAEFCALRFCDLTNDGVHIEHQFQYNRASKEHELKEPKTISGDRIICYSDGMLKALDLIKSTRKNTDNDFIFVRKNGKPWNRHDWSELLTRISNAYNRTNKEHPIPIITSHTPRHTYATLMAHNGLLPVELGNQLGHKDARTTNRYYIHDDIEHRKNDVSEAFSKLNITEQESRNIVKFDKNKQKRA